jgi:hypothetical protein
VPELALDASRAVDVLESTAREASSLDAWIDTVTQAADALLPTPLGNGALLVEAREGGGGSIAYASRGPAMSDELMDYSGRRMNESRIFEPFFIDAPHVGTLADVRPNLSDQNLARHAGLPRDAESS